MKVFFRWLSTLWAACPYTMLGKKALQSVRRMIIVEGINGGKITESKHKVGYPHIN
jgi:hypothetical protein